MAETRPARLLVFSVPGASDVAVGAEAVGAGKTGVLWVKNPLDPADIVSDLPLCC